VTAQVRGGERHNHDVRDPGSDLLVAAWADVLLGRLIRLDPPQLRLGSGHRVLHESRREPGRGAPAWPGRARHELNYGACMRSSLLTRAQVTRLRLTVR